MGSVIQAGGKQEMKICSRCLTNESTCSTLMATTSYIKANRAVCANTPHGSDPTLSTAVTGLHRIIRYRETSVLRGFCGPTDSPVGLGRFVVLVAGKV